jgi:hypothetical protein
MLYRTALLWLAATRCYPGAAMDLEPFAGPQPMAVLLQRDPSTPVVGAETPRIAIYQNGDVIYSRTGRDPEQKSYFFTTLSFDALATLEDQLRSVTNLARLKPEYVLNDVSDDSTTFFYLQVGNREVVTSVFGLHPGNTKGSPGEDLPAALLQLYNYLWNLDFPESRRWHPALLEAMIWPDDTPGESILWPSTWPDLKSGRSMKRDDGYSIFLDGSMQGDLQKFMAIERTKGVVEIDGQNWTMAWRPVLPSEPVWRKALSNLEGN